mmetsp:Transcript_8323/g.18178  ORF Transcript_8323/g.18178 Transcript_8323/m.18178 type:complete len:270 (+) Transcript_8323:215-1024(+)
MGCRSKLYATLLHILLASRIAMHAIPAIVQIPKPGHLSCFPRTFDGNSRLRRYRLLRRWRLPRRWRLLRRYRHLRCYRGRCVWHRCVFSVQATSEQKMYASIVAGAQSSDKLPLEFKVASGDVASCSAGAGAPGTFSAGSASLPFVASTWRSSYSIEAAEPHRRVMHTRPLSSMFTLVDTAFGVSADPVSLLGPTVVSFASLCGFAYAAAASWIATPSLWRLGVRMGEGEQLRSRRRTCASSSMDSVVDTAKEVSCTLASGSCTLAFGS